MSDGSPQSRGASLAALAAIFLFLAVAAWRLHAGWSDGPAPLPLNISHAANDSPASRTLVIIIPGTHGNEGYWPVISPGQATFGSELRRGAGPDTDVYPFLWSAPNAQAQRLQAANNLARVIDEKATMYERVCLVGHSYGGDIALYAAGLCKSRVDLVACLSTPHLYLVGKTPAGDVQLPVYCTAASRKNIRKIITVCPDVDHVPDYWADVRTGVSENDAIRLASGWLEFTGFPRLKEDGWMHDLGLSDNLDLTRNLNMADENIEYFSQVEGIAQPHYCVHSRRMGFVLGKLIGSGADQAAVDYLRTIIQPADSDWGEPIPASEYQNWLNAHAAARRSAGHVLHGVSVKLWGRDASVDPYFKLCTADGGKVISKTDKASGRRAFFHARWLVRTGQRERLDLWDARVFGDALLGSDPVDGAGPVPDFVTHAGGKDQWSWSARLDWSAVHE